ncbi:tyrosine-protein phosphatase 10D-like isoform X2 [Chrysoperla carnea]|uniref:tyrosine-protein phosphatase 10D-like isoform X2 n=1 Tax=Chrysoperla carnea TaxID=189513 RepID=UPI001D0812A2|nr:tyrosine-protein phosphatase 10D-like isoform X2 [Chrysoperla carnea]
MKNSINCFNKFWTFSGMNIVIQLIFIYFCRITETADLVISISGISRQEGATYRLNYSPPHGVPAPNTTIASRDIVDDNIQFSQGLPGTKYDFRLYYSNETYTDWLTWTASITTAPDPPANLSVSVRGGKTAIVSWDPPAQGGHSSYRMKLVPLSHSDKTKPQQFQIEESELPYTFKDLTPGASYQVQAFTIFDGKESVAYTSRNFTTKMNFRRRYKPSLSRKPNTPGKFIVWFRNETTLLVLWQPPYPAGVYTHYKVSIEPPDAADSILYVEKEGEPPGPAQAAFKGLVPGRAYNISVQTMSEDEISTPTTSQYRTVPNRPGNVTIEKVTSNSFRVNWEPPQGFSEFDKYQVSYGTGRKQSPPVTRSREDQATWWEFKDNLEPGKKYQVVVKTVSGKVASWPSSGDVTLIPLPVQDLHATTDERTGVVTLHWTPDPNGVQDEFLITYHEVDTLNGDSNDITAYNTSLELENLLPGRNYSIIVQAVSSKMKSNETSTHVATRPSAPIIEDLRPIIDGLNISWKSDVNSRQDKYEIQYIRNDTGDRETKTTQGQDTRIILTGLYPGAGYNVKVYAVSHEGLRSEPHKNFQAVFPRPPRNISVERMTSTSVVVHWEPPYGSIFSEYAIRYRTDSGKIWINLPSVTDNEAEVFDMIPGEKYTIQVNTVSFNVESNGPLQVNQTVRPNPVSNIAPLVDSSNVTLEWPRPEGRVEIYIVRWWATDHENDVHQLNVTQPPEVLDSLSSSANNVRVLIGELIPGIEYTFQIRTMSYNLESDVTVLSARTMPLIQSEVVVVNKPQETDSISLRYTPTPQTSSHFDLYRFKLSASGVPIIEKGANDSERLVTFTGLEPGRLYNITVWTVSHGVASQPLQRQDRLYPEPITSINATQIKDTEITLNWDTPRGEFNAFEVQYLTTENIYIQNLTLHNYITIMDLKPHRNYTFTVVVRSGTESSVLRRSLPVSAIFTTKESVPGKVDSFHPVDIHPSDVLFQWALPSTEQNGIILRFTITYGLEGSSHTQVKEFKPNEFRGIIKSLIPGKQYVFRIQAETKIGFGPEAIWKQKMPILAPPKPNTRVVPTEVYKSSTTIQIRFRKNYFSEQNGAVVSYAIIVAEDDSKNSSSLEMPTWRDVQAYTLWPPYQVMDPYYPFQNSSVEDFTIGTSACDVRQQGYCNGPLKSGSTYRVKIRAFTAPDKFTDTSYSFPIQTDQDNTPIVFGITIPVTLLILLLVGVILLRRHRSAGRKATETRGNDTVSLPDSVIDPNRPVLIENFSDHYRIMSADSDFRFSEEFEELKHVGRDQPCTFADLPCNRPKNRFTNILPYDHSRFKLQPVDDEEGSDYINANYVPGHNSPREFIVTQGPLHSTRDDFWRMCWESNSRAIIMLTKCIEKGREKCDHYWPYDTLPVYYGDIFVQILNESLYPDWNVTEFMVCRGDVQRVITHFHFTTWPDFGVPNPPHTLVRFVRAFREKIRPDQRPIVVHCSAGVGRSGTFITLDRILQQIQVADYVDIFGIVWAMRKERVWMVQTEQQYICIHQCLLAVLEGKELTGPPREIHDNQGFEDDEGIAESGM